MPTVYILTNPAMPSLVKIGCTERPIEDRMRELSRASGVPLPFECFLAVDVADHREIERAMHYAFGDRRLNPNKEFFELSPDRPAAILQMFQNRPGARDVTPESDVVENPAEQQALDKERLRRANFSFSQVGIKPRDILTSAFDPAQVCIVIDDKYVEFPGSRTSLSRAALVLAHETGRKWKAVQGPQFWNFEGRSLSERRDIIENYTGNV